MNGAVPPTLPVPPAPFPWWVMPGLAALVLVIFGGALAASCFIDNDTLRTQMFTGAFGLATAAVSYFFGSSASSAKKDDATTASMAKKDDTIAAMPAVLATSAPSTTTTTGVGPHGEAASTVTTTGGATAPASVAVPLI